MVAAEAVHEQYGVGAFGKDSVVHAFAVLPVAGHDRLRAVTDEGVVAGAGNERAGHTLKNRGVGGVRGNGGGHGYLSRVGYWDGKVPFLILGEKPERALKPARRIDNRAGNRAGGAVHLVVEAASTLARCGFRVTLGGLSFYQPVFI